MARTNVEQLRSFLSCGPVVYFSPRRSAYLNIPAIRQEIQKRVRGQSAHLYPDDLSTLPVPLVPDDVQHAVKAKFDYGQRRFEIKPLHSPAKLSMPLKLIL